MAIDGVSTLYQAVKGRPSGTESGSGWTASSPAGRGLPAAGARHSALTLVYVASFWSIAIGIFRLIMAFRLGSIMMGLFGAITVFFGAWLLLNPGPGLVALIWIVGIEAMVAGGLMIGLGWRLRRVANDPHGPAAGRG